MSQNLVTDRLQNMVDPKDPDSKSLYSHLSHLVAQLGQFESDKISPIGNFEAISEYIKKYQFTAKSPLNEQQLKQFITNKIKYPSWLNSAHQLDQLPTKDTSDRLVQPFELQAQRLFDKVGVGFGLEQSNRIYKALKRLAETKQAVRVRFWGKIFTRSGDYYVVEGVTKHSNAGEATLDMEKAKEGANYNTYWVAQGSLSEDWYELPLLTTQQLRAARLIKYAFTGALNNPVQSSPPFPGQEKHLLKAQIVRITHNCEIAPKGMYSPLQDNPDEVDFSQEFKMGEFSELSNLENWVHFNPYLLKLGRSTYYVDPKVPEEQKEEVLAKLAETDPKIERLKAINEDKGLEKFGLEGCWTVRTYGSTQLFNNVGKEEGTTSCYGVVALRNPHWPGWTTVASNKQFGSIYIGYALKSSQPSFHPLAPEDLSLQPQEVQEFGEPNPKDPPDQLQPDSDEENKKAEE